MRLELLRLHRSLKATTVYVTHDQVEAMTLAHRIAVLNKGRLAQLGEPAALYDRPASTFVARFFGTPEMNLLSGQIKDGVFAADATTLRAPVPGYPSGPALLGARAEHLHLWDEAAADAPDTLVGSVDVIEHLGSETLVHVRVGEQLLVARCAVEHTPKVSSRVALRLDPAHWHLFAAPAAEQDGARLVAES
jgi:ABC-type sugar transport system ATPase subunit